MLFRQYAKLWIIGAFSPECALFSTTGANFLRKGPVDKPGITWYTSKQNNRQGGILPFADVGWLH